MQIMSVTDLTCKFVLHIMWQQALLQAHYNTFMLCVGNLAEYEKLRTYWEQQVTNSNY